MAGLNVDVDGLRNLVRAEMKEKRMNQTAYADHIGISRPFLNNFLRGRAEPGEKLLHALGYTQITRYQRKEN